MLHNIVNLCTSAQCIWNRDYSVQFFKGAVYSQSCNFLKVHGKSKAIVSTMKLGACRCLRNVIECFISTHSVKKSENKLNGTRFLFKSIVDTYIYI